MSNRTRLQVGEYKRSIYYQLPKYLIHDPEFKGMSSNSKILYSLLLDRLRHSLRNKWVDEHGHVYLRMSRQEMTELAGVSEKTATKMMNELKSYKLLEEKRLGQGRTNLIYITAPTNPVIEPPDEHLRTVIYDEQQREKERALTRISEAPKAEKESFASSNKNEGSKNNGREKQAPAHFHEYGKFKKVILTEGEFDELTTLYGAAKRDDYIERLDLVIASKKRNYHHHFPLIQKWIKEDKPKAAEKTQTKPNRFVNFEQPEYDYEELERLEREYLNNKLAANGSDTIEAGGE